MESDLITTASLLGVGDPNDLIVQREVSSGRNRPDLVITSTAGNAVGVIEVKLLSALGNRQLARYEAGVPEAEREDTTFLLVHPERLPIPVDDRPRWQALSWEAVLGAFARSGDAWTAATAQAAIRHLDTALPDVGAETSWRQIPAGEDFVVALRARQSWIYRQILDPPRGYKDLLSSSAGVSWVNVVRIPTGRPGYSIIFEAEETLTVRDWPKFAGQDHRVPRGPSVRLCLIQEGVSTSADFDWDWLLHLWTAYMAQADKPWVMNSSNPRAAHDRAGRDRMRQLGAPKHLGIGYGEGQVRWTGECMFGARYFLGDVNLQAVANDLNETTELALTMADCTHW